MTVCVPPVNGVYIKYILQSTYKKSELETHPTAVSYCLCGQFKM